MPVYVILQAANMHIFNTKYFIVSLRCKHSAYVGITTVCSTMIIYIENIITGETRITKCVMTDYSGMNDAQSALKLTMFSTLHTFYTHKEKQILRAGLRAKTALDSC